MNSLSGVQKQFSNKEEYNGNYILISQKRHVWSLDDVSYAETLSIKIVMNILSEILILENIDFTTRRIEIKINI